MNDFFRGPDFARIQFLAEPFRLIMGLALAALVLYCAWKAITHLFSLAGAGENTHKARGAGIGIAFAVAAAVIAFMFAGLFIDLVSAARSS